MPSPTSCRRRLLPTLAGVAGALVLGSCSAAGSGGSGTGPGAATGAVSAVAAENQYGDVVSQIGGHFVTVSSVMRNPNVDPHDYEISPKVAQEVGGAELVVQNGAGYDSFMDKIEQASPHPGRVVVDAQSLLGLPANTPNPHLWYSPGTMPAVAKAVAGALEKMDPAHAGTFSANLAAFDSSMQSWSGDIASLRAGFAGIPVATTEPVADYMLEAAGLDNVTPFSFQADVMNGVDPSPQDVSSLRRLLSQHRVKAFVYNQQVTDSLTESLVAAARASAVPVVAVYETMPTPGYHYQSWMTAETQAVRRALDSGQSTNRL